MRNGKNPRHLSNITSRARTALNAHFTGPHVNEKRAGTYTVCCGEPLFISDTKFESGTGWPSFYKPLEGSAIDEHEDRSWFMRRTEVRCAKCDAHLSHVFPDGPNPTGLRYCISGCALTLCAERQQIKSFDAAHHFRARRTRITNVVPTNPLMPDAHAAEPRAPQQPSTSVWHGITLTDEYALAERRRTGKP